MVNDWLILGKMMDLAVSHRIRHRPVETLRLFREGELGKRVVSDCRHVQTQVFRNFREVQNEKELVWQDRGDMMWEILREDYIFLPEENRSAKESAEARKALEDIRDAGNLEDQIQDELQRQAIPWDWTPAWEWPERNPEWANADRATRLRMIAGEIPGLPSEKREAE